MITDIQLPNDFLVLGANGFAQLGTEDFEAKNKIEDSVLLEIIELHPIFLVPEKYKEKTSFKIETFQYGSNYYTGLILIFDTNDSTEEFWKWANIVEQYDFEQEIITEYCQKKFEGIECKLELDSDNDLTIKYL